MGGAAMAGTQTALAATRVYSGTSSDRISETSIIPMMTLTVCLNARPRQLRATSAGRAETGLHHIDAITISSNPSHIQLNPHARPSVVSCHRHDAALCLLVPLIGLF